MRRETYYNPVEVIQSNNWVKSLQLQQDKLKIQRSLIITSRGNVDRLELESLFPESNIYSGVMPNPTVASCQNAIEHCLTHNSFDGIIALGGGSAMDTAKCVMAAFNTGTHNLTKLLNTDPQYRDHIPSIFIPTTHGTASEVTAWGTVWDMEAKKKYSLSHKTLYPSAAILDPELCLTLPLDISLITTLDALSHSFEAIWNKNRTARSTKYAIEAITAILANADHLKTSPNNLEIRAALLNASTTAGLAFSQTRTAAAHSISYPLTIYYQIPHGIAASISLIPLLEINAPKIFPDLKSLYVQAQLSDLGQLQERILSIPDDRLKFRLRDWGIKRDDLNWLATHCFTTGRMDNNIIDLSIEGIQDILMEIY